MPRRLTEEQRAKRKLEIIEYTRKYQAEYRKRPGYKEACAARARRYKEKNRERLKAERLERYRNRPADWRCARHLRQKYGITVEEWNALYEKQQGLCLICNKPMAKENSNKSLRTAVDHNHETGKVRGILHDKCNRALGFFDDDPDKLRHAAEYLETHDNEANLEESVCWSGC